MLGTISAPAQYLIDTYAGTTSIGDGGPAIQALLREPNAVARDASGGYYIADLDHSLVRYVNASGVISTFAGIPYQRGFGASGTPANQTPIANPSGVAVDAQGNVFFAEYIGCVIRKVDRQGIQTIVAGILGNCGISPITGPATQVPLPFPTDIDVDAQGRVLIVDSFSGRIRRVETNGTISVVAGGGSSRAEGVAATTAVVTGPHNVAAAPDGSVYYGEQGNANRVRRVDSAGIVNTVAGGSATGNAGDGGPALQATFSGGIRGIAVDGVRNKLYIVDRSAHRIRVVDLNSGIISHFAGQTGATVGGYSGDGGAATAAALHFPMTARVDPDGSVAIVDRSNQAIRRVSPNGTITALAGRERKTGETPVKQLEMIDPASVAFDARGVAYIVDRGGLSIRRVGLDGMATRITSPLFSDLRDLAFDGQGRLFVLDGGRLRLIVDDRVEPLFSQDLTLGGILTAPTRMAIDKRSNKIYFVIRDRHQISVLDLGATPPRYGSFAGSGVAGFAGDGGAASLARFNNPYDVAVDDEGGVYVADYFNNRLRRIAPNGIVETVAGSGPAVTVPDVLFDNPARISPYALAIGRNGSVYFAESQDIRRFDPATRSVSVVAMGRVVTPQPNGSTITRLTTGNSGDGGEATYAAVAPTWIRSDGAGNIYLGTLDNRVRYMRPYEVSGFEIVSGNYQSATVGRALAAPLVARATTTLGPISNLFVNFSVRSGPAFLTPATAWSNYTDSTGQVRVNIVLGATAGQAVIRATTGTRSVEFLAQALGSDAATTRPALRMPGGVTSAAAFGGATTIAPGTWIEIYGSNFSTATRSWRESDFAAGRGPVELEGVRVIIGNREAYVAYVSPTQINAQVPDGIGAGPVDLMVWRAGSGSSEPVKVTAAANSPGILAPAVFQTGGVQYAVAIHADGAYVGRENLIPGVAFRPAKEGDVLVFYGIGFGDTSPRAPAGSVAGANANVQGLTVEFGDKMAELKFAGLAPGAIGLYQFNVTVPAGLSAGDVAVRFRLRGAAVPQTLSLTVQ
jgi:uncharacterized protein (TIGR03437 family)